MRLKRLSQQMFDRSAEKTKLGEQTRKMSHAVLVDGRAPEDVAAEYGMPIQRVKSAVASIRREHMKAIAQGANSILVETGVWT